MKSRKTKPKITVVGFKDTKGLAAKLKQLAHVEDLSVSQVLRRMVVEKLTEKRLLP